jgi:hypothetical protein
VNVQDNHAHNTLLLLSVLDEVVIQPALVDLALIDGKRFTIRFYVSVVSGKVYLHRGGSIKTGSKFNASSVRSFPFLLTVLQ